MIEYLRIDHVALHVKNLAYSKSFYKKHFEINKKQIKTLPFQVRKTLPVIFTLEGLIYIPHLNICELNLLKKSIESQTIDFFDKKYDNIL